MARGSRLAGLYLASRAAGFLAVLTSMWLAPSLRISQAYTAWDAGSYLGSLSTVTPAPIAAEFGVGNPWAFFPGFPIVVRLTKDLTGLSYVHAAILAAWVLGGLAAVAIGLFVRDVLGDGNRSQGGGAGGVTSRRRIS